MSEKEALTFREKQDVLRKVFNQYHRAKIKLHCLEISEFYPGIQYDAVRETKSPYIPINMSSILNSNIDDKDELRRVVIAFEYIISSLSYDSRRIVENEFLNQKKSDWWREYYAKSTYYRLKGVAMEELLFYLNL